MTVMGNNPGNIRYDGTGWLGLDAPPNDEKGFCRFVSVQAGCRAIAKVLLTYYEKHDLRTVEDIVRRWAPPSENDTPAYIEDVCARLHVRPYEIIDLMVDSTLSDLVAAMAHHETGEFIDKTIIDAAVRSVLDGAQAVA